MKNTKKITVVVLSWKRPKNILLILGNLYSSQIVNEIILWNNNPQLKFSQKHKKLLIINSPKNFGTLARWCIAQTAINTNILFLDDDLIITPKQIEILFNSYLKNTDQIHGCFGRNLENGKYVIKPAIEKVDIVLGRVMLFNKKHLYKFFQWLGDRNGNVEDDILFSLAFKNKHLVTDVGKIKELPEPYALSKRYEHIYLRQEMVDFCLKNILNPKNSLF